MRLCVLLLLLSKSFDTLQMDMTSLSNLAEPFHMVVVQLRRQTRWADYTPTCGAWHEAHSPWPEGLAWRGMVWNRD